MGKKATIRDVAQRAGFSVATVSLVMNHKDQNLSPATREKVLTAAAELDYKPNPLAVGLITNRTRMLGLIIPDSCNDFFASLSKELERNARRYGYSILYGNTDNDPERDLEYLQMFCDKRAEGIILVKSAAHQAHGEEKTVRFIQKCDIPVITIDRKLHEGPTRAFVLNHFKGGYLATRHLLQLGHRRIGVYTGPNTLASSNERLEGYRSALAEMEIPFDSRLVFEGNYQLGREKEALTSLLNGYATAIFCFNDVMAAGIYREARNLGISIPRDLSVVGFDNVGFSEIIDPPLTTVAQPIGQISEQAIRTIVEMIEEGEPQDARPLYLFEPKLIVRESSRKYTGGGCSLEDLESRFAEH